MLDVAFSRRMCCSRAYQADLKELTKLEQRQREEVRADRDQDAGAVRTLDERRQILD